MGRPSKMLSTSIASRCLAVVTEGPATTGEVASELGLTAHSAGTHMALLHKRGKVVREPFVKTASAGRPGPRHVWLWSSMTPTEASRAGQKKKSMSEKQWKSS